MQFPFSSIIKNFDPVYGFIIVMTSFIFLTLLKVIETVKATQKAAKKHQQKYAFSTSDAAIDSPDDFRESQYPVEEMPEIIILPFRSSPEKASHHEDYGIELSSIPLSSSVSFTEHDIANLLENTPENVTFSDPFSFIQTELKNDPEIQNFTLFTNPQHIFSGALKEIFTKKTALVLNHLEDYKFKIYPFYQIEDTQIKRLHLDERKNILIEELFELWRMGYSHPALPELFIHYFFAIKSKEAPVILKSMIFHDQVDLKQFRRLCFLYQDVLCQTILFSDIQEELPVKISDAFDFANIIIHRNIFLTRKKWRNWEESIFSDLQEDRKGDFYLFYFDLLARRTSLILYYQLIGKFKHILNNPYREFIERQAFYYGHYDKLRFLSFVPPEFSLLISKSASDSVHQVEDLLSLTTNYPFSELHRFLIYHINKSPELENYEIDSVKLNELLKNLDVLPGKKNYIPQAIRFILYLYFYEKKDLQKLNYISPYIHGRIGKFIPLVYQARLLFKNRQYERAWLEINNLWNNDEGNMLLMNETAIYAYHSGRMKEAEELFSRLRHLYPENVQILHNEAVFLQHKARLISENQKLHAAPVSREKRLTQKTDQDDSQYHSKVLNPVF